MTNSERRIYEEAHENKQAAIKKFNSYQENDIWQLFRNNNYHYIDNLEKLKGGFELVIEGDCVIEDYNVYYNDDTRLQEIDIREVGFDVEITLWKGGEDIIIQETFIA